jgi:membrane protease YdiL (CAAX protease family)
MHDVEINRAADRPLWRRIADFPLVAMVLAIALFVAALAVSSLIGKLLPLMSQTATLAANAAISILLVFAVYKVAIARLGERPRDDLPLSKAPVGIGAGLLLGGLLFAAVVGVAALTDVYNIIGQGSTAQLLPALIAMAIVPGFMEELLFRGILFRFLEEFGGSWFALALTSALFGLGHIFNPNASVFASVAIAIEAGVLLGGAYMLTRNLWLAIGIHAAWNFTQGFIFDVPVSGIDQNGLVEARLSGPELLSGGQFGLEASAIAMVLATGTGIALVAMSVRRDGAVRPWWTRRRLEAASGDRPAAV